MGVFTRRSSVVLSAIIVLAAALVAPAGAAIQLARPTAPRSVHASPGAATATVHWAKSARGTQPTYRVVSSPTSRGCATRALFCSVTGLTNATGYRFRVRATSHGVSGPWSAWSAVVTPHATLTGMSVSPVKGIPLVQPLATVSDGTDLWVLNSGGGYRGHQSLTKTTLATRHTSVITGGPLAASAAHFTGLASNGTDVFLTASYDAQSSGAVYEMNIATGVFTPIVSSLFSDPTAVVATPAAAYVLSFYGEANSTGAIVRVDLATGAITEIESALFNQSNALAISPGTLWITNQAGGVNPAGSLLTVDLATSAVREVDDPSFNNPVAVVADATSVVVLNEPAAPAAHSISVLTIATGTVHADTSPALAGVSAVALDAGTLWLATTTGGTYGDGSLLEVNRVSGSVAPVNSALFVTPGFIATGAGLVFVVSVNTMAVANPHGTMARYGPGPLPPGHPAANLSPMPAYNHSVCTYSARYVYTNTPACTAAQVQAISVAHLAEGVKPMVLPINWNSLSVAEQIFVVTDLERVDRGLPPYLGINAALSANAQAAADTGKDPTVAARFPLAAGTAGSLAFGGVWSGNFSPLSADFGWMYSDGWGGSQIATFNFACTRATALGCWGHRDEILGDPPGSGLATGLRCTTCEVGVGYALLPRYHWGSYVALIERPAHAPPPMTFTWAHDVAPFLPTR